MNSSFRQQRKEGGSVPPSHPSLQRDPHHAWERDVVVVNPPVHYSSLVINAVANYSLSHFLGIMEKKRGGKARASSKINPAGFRLSRPRLLTSLNSLPFPAFSRQWKESLRRKKEEQSLAMKMQKREEQQQHGSQEGGGDCMTRKKRDRLFGEEERKGVGSGDGEEERHAQNGMPTSPRKVSEKRKKKSAQLHEREKEASFLVGQNFRRDKMARA